MASRLKILLYNIDVFKSICENQTYTLHTDIQITVHAIFKVKFQPQHIIIQSFFFFQRSLAQIVETKHHFLQSLQVTNSKYFLNQLPQIHYHNSPCLKPADILTVHRITHKLQRTRKTIDLTVYVRWCYCICRERNSGKKNLKRHGQRRLSVQDFLTHRKHCAFLTYSGRRWEKIL